MSTDRAFSIKIAFFNSLGFCMATAVATFLDAQLCSHIIYGQRHYPLGFWICLFSPLIFVINYLCLMKFHSRNKKIYLPTLTLLIFGGLSLINFLPEFPHLGVSLWICLFCLASIISSWVRFYPTAPEYLYDPRIKYETKKEWVKESIATWRLASVGTSFGFMAMLIPWFIAIWNLPEKSFKSEKDIIMVSTYMSIETIIFIIYVLRGPIYELFRKTNVTADLLLKIKQSEGD